MSHGPDHADDPRPGQAGSDADRASTWAPLIDRFGRRHNNLRISVTDRCNIRCFYCMPAENVRFKPRAEILTFEEIERFVRVAVRLGVNKLRLTGGEPLVRAELPLLIERLAAIDGIDDIGLTTNGILLAEQAQALKAAGLHRLNISLDALNPETFRQITRREGFERVLEGIFAAQAAGFKTIKLNAVAIAGITEAEVVPFGHFARQHGLEVRFIEFMPLDADNAWQNDQVLPGEKIRAMLEEAIAPLVPLERSDPSQPATDYMFADGIGRIGFINPVSQPFCHDCNRLRITADGKMRNCLFGTEEWDARAVMREASAAGDLGGPDSPGDIALADLIRACVLAKRPGHGINQADFVKPERAMFQIGG